MSIFNGRLRYDQRPVVGLAENVADNEPARAALVGFAAAVTPSPEVPGFVVGHHHHTVTLDVRHGELGPDDAYRLGLQLMWAADLARLETP